MPFTFSHPAIILPLTKWKWFSTTALIIGSMGPDFEYFLRMRMYGSIGHSFAGIFLFNLPLVLLLAFIYHNWVRNSLLANLPRFLRKHLIAYQTFDWNTHFKKNSIAIIISAIVGTVSHIIWDGFTHANGIFVELLPFLRGSMVIGGIRLKAFSTLQQASTIVGFIVVVYWILKLHPIYATPAKNITPYWAWAGCVCAIITTLRFLLGSEPFNYIALIVTVIPAGMLGISVASLIAGLKNNQPTKTTPS